MNINILHLGKGASEARGVAVIIDVFRAFTFEAYALAQGADKILAVYDMNTAEKLAHEIPNCYLAGERHGKILPGFDFGNSPSSIRGIDFTGKTIIHTTSNGTYGISQASKSDEIILGSLVNASATAAYIRGLNSDEVSLVCMGWEGRRTEEDELCAEYLKSLLEGRKMKDIHEKADALRYTEGKKFFDPTQQDVFPEEDFAMCVNVDAFHFAIHTEMKNGIAVSVKGKTYE